MKKIYLYERRAGWDCREGQHQTFGAEKDNRRRDREMLPVLVVSGRLRLPRPNYFGQIEH
jgi:hypothetical protein